MAVRRAMAVFGSPAWVLVWSRVISVIVVIVVCFVAWAWWAGLCARPWVGRSAAPSPMMQLLGYLFPLILSLFGHSTWYKMADLCGVATCRIIIVYFLFVCLFVLWLIVVVFISHGGDFGVFVIYLFVYNYRPVCLIPSFIISLIRKIINYFMILFRSCSSPSVYSLFLIPSFIDLSHSYDRNFFFFFSIYTNFSFWY